MLLVVEYFFLLLHCKKWKMTWNLSNCLKGVMKFFKWSEKGEMIFFEKFEDDAQKKITNFVKGFWKYIANFDVCAFDHGIFWELVIKNLGNCQSCCTGNLVFSKRKTWNIFKTMMSKTSFDFVYSWKRLPELSDE